MDCLRSTGTLIVAGPSRDGLIIAADTCATLPDGQKYSKHKLIILTRPRRTVLAVAGTVVIHPDPPEGTTDIIDFIHKTKPLLDLEEVAHDCLEAGPDELTEEIIRNTAAACTEAANELIRNHPEVLTKLKHPDFFHLMVTSFQPSTGKSTIGTCRACVENGVLRTLEPKWIEFEPSSVFDTLFIGESKWVKEEVVPQPEFMEIACKCGVGSSSVADTTLETSEKVCVAIIELAAKTAASSRYPPSSGIEPPIDVLFIGEKEPPVKRHWASFDN